MKMIINKCYGEFGFSNEAKTLFREIDGHTSNDTDLRTNHIMVEIVEELGKLASSKYSELKVIEIPDDIDWVVKEYDGVEWIAERHRTWN